MIERIMTNTALHIHSPWFLLVIPFIIILLIAAWRKKRPTLIVSSIKSYKSAVSDSRMWLSPVHIPLLFEGLGLLCLVIALIRPQHGIEETIRRTEGIDIMLALDLSGSMKAYDIPENLNNRQKISRMLESGELKPRIDVAKNEVKEFIDRRPNDRIGIVGFAANTYTVCPPTLDHGFLKGNLDRLEAGMLPDGTGIAAPIATASARLKESEAKRRVLVLFTDGDNNVDAKISPLQAARISRMFDVNIHTVGIGSNRAIILQPDFFGRRRMVGIDASFNQKLLEEISDVTSGQYFAAEDAEGLRRVMKEIDKLEKTSVEQPTYIDYKELYRVWLNVGLVLLVVGFVAEYTFCLKIP